ncbi:MAG: D-2-hydroxyacid dehydrogenase family protein [Pseudomonadota bacterium]
MADWNSLPNCEVTFFHDSVQEPEAQVARFKDFDILCTMRQRMALPNEVLARLPGLKMIAATGGAQQSIDFDECTRRGIVVSGTSGGSQTTVEITFGLLLAVARNIPLEDRMLRQGRWQTTTGGQTLRDKTLLIVGLGNIGTEVARIARDGFKMRVNAWGQTLTPERAAKAGVDYLSREEAFSSADFVSVHLKLVPATRGLINRSDFARMKPTAAIINTSRAPVIEREALLEALQQRKIGGAGLDVHYREPALPDDPFLKLDNIVITPHLGYVTDERLRNMHKQQVENIRDFLAGKPAKVLNKEVLEKK